MLGISSREIALLTQVYLLSDRVLWKVYGCNLQDTFWLFGRAITMTSRFAITCLRYEQVAQL